MDLFHCIKPEKDTEHDIRNHVDEIKEEITIKAEPHIFLDSPVASVNNQEKQGISVSNINNRTYQYDMSFTGAMPYQCDIYNIKFTMVSN